MSRIITGSVIIALLASTANEATAGPLKIMLTDLTSGDFVEVQDLDGDGVLTFNGTVGAFTMQVTTGISKPQLGNNLSLAKMHLSNTSITTDTGGTLEILMTDTNFLIAPVRPLVLTSQIGGVTDGLLEASTILDRDNGEYTVSGPDATTVSHSAFTFGAFSEEVTANLDYSGGPFSITDRVLLTLGPESSTSFDLVTTVAPIPEPGTLPLALIGVSAAALWYQRQRQLLARLAR